MIIAKYCKFFDICKNDGFRIFTYCFPTFFPFIFGDWWFFCAYILWSAISPLMLQFRDKYLGSDTELLADATRLKMLLQWNFNLRSLARFFKKIEVLFAFFRLSLEQDDDPSLLHRYCKIFLHYTPNWTWIKTCAPALWWRNEATKYSY